MYQRPRVMPVLLMGNAGLVKTQRFEKPKYLGDPINTVKIFNDKEVDELVLLDILSTSRGRPIQFDVIQEIVSEAFVPVTYGGGVRSVSDVSRLLALGVEKISLNTAATDDPKLLGDIADRFGSSTLVVSIDAAKRRRRYEVMTSNGTRGTGRDPATFASEVQRLGAGEILINSVDRDGTMEGYDIELLAAGLERGDGSDRRVRWSAVGRGLPPCRLEGWCFGMCSGRDVRVPGTSPRRLDQLPQPGGARPRIRSAGVTTAPVVYRMCTRCVMDTSDPDDRVRRSRDAATTAPATTTQIKLFVEHRRRAPRDASTGSSAGSRPPARASRTTA